MVASLFVALTPGVLLTLPKNGSKLTVAAVHGAVFVLALFVVNKYVWRGCLEGYAAYDDEDDEEGFADDDEEEGFKKMKRKMKKHRR